MGGGKAVFLDRDGVLNKCRVIDGKPYPPLDADSMEIASDVEAALVKLKNVGFRLICVTNQPDVARGGRTIENVRAMNDKIRNLLPLDAIYVCLHDNSDNCDCRKPKPGMLFTGAREFSLELAECFMVGDRAGDICAGRSAGCRTVFLDGGYLEPKPEPKADFTCESLLEAVNWILEQNSAAVSR